MQHKWILLVGDDGKAFTSVDRVTLLDDAVVVDLRDAIKEKFKDSHLAGIAAADLTVFADGAAFEAKQKLEEDSPINALGAAKKGALIVVVKAPSALRLTAQASYPPFLKKAIEIANVMLTHNRYFELDLSADSTTRRNLRDVKVKFRRPEKGSLYGWTDRSASAKVIFVNEVLLHRMETLGQADNSHEYQCIVFVLAATIFHECAHLALRWKNILDSPSKYKFEVGTFMETVLFQGTCRVKIQQSTRATSKRSKRSCGVWTKEMPILDVVIDGNGLSVIRADHLNKFFTPGKLCDKALFPLELATYRRTKGATAYLDADRKRRRTSPEDPNIMMPPLCGISENRHARRKLSV
ncbi:CRN domain-containing protein-containing protein [Phytophthora infestans T30-4]|uniref:CRN domain-containing protein-containing protein n=1 Tax=Phytophthora infestans (strain T30-4) TaxID=403677 RepID=D0NSQ9_PHYIT|nr:CRN domain-containing protein-containing protein [Phytophthora infestans T30-4]EEY64621.1 CRN domain-containing protein-containing protein [Phytophthora infestans T30-4]|eukprot:XP_002897821.1 CRN domain-containing protein-containing protein [Phytophthora infestans T30-4]